MAFPKRLRTRHTSLQFLLLKSSSEFVVMLIECLPAGLCKEAALHLAEAGSSQSLPSHGCPHHTTHLKVQGLGNNQAPPRWPSITPAPESPLQQSH